MSRSTESNMQEVIHKEDKIFLGYTREELSKAFHEVADPDNWKEAIQATIPASDFDIVNSAVIFFTGGGLEIVKEMERGGEIFYDVFGHGYYVHIGA